MPEASPAFLRIAVRRVHERVRVVLETAGFCGSDLGRILAEKKQKQKVSARPSGFLRP